MRHLGDITKLDGACLEPVNVVIGGSPCQDLSVAGRREGLSGERSGLFMEQIRIIKEMRDADRILRGRSGKDVRPRFMVWENVPGALSSNSGRDFAAVLEETIRIVLKEAPDIPVPKNGWPTAGCISVGGDRPVSVAYRVLDAQFWGVPQRRRRIALVADFAGQCAQEILFEREGSRWDPQTSGKAWERITGNAQAGPAGSDSAGTDSTVIVNNVGGQAEYTTESGTSPTLKAAHSKHPMVIAEHKSEPVILDRSAGFCTEHSAKSRSIGYEEEVSPTLRAGIVPAAVIERNPGVSDRSAGFCVQQSARTNGIGYQEDTAPTLVSGMIPAAVIEREPVTYLGETVTSPTNKQNPQPGDPCHTLTADTRNYLVRAIENHPNDSRVTLPEDNMVQTLTGRMGTGGGNVPMILQGERYAVENHPMDSRIFIREDGVVQTPATRMGSGDPGTPLVMQSSAPEMGTFAMQGFGDYKESDVLSGCKARDYKDATDLIVTNRPGCRYIVRRLTPLECERLQGFPDGWTNIGDWTDAKGKKRKGDADAPRYKALGNSIALPPWCYVLTRLSLVCGGEQTMGSLFDGIGGFPLIWETINGKNTCLWASEIEDFPIAVTQKRLNREE